MKSYILTLILTMTSIVALSQYRYSVEVCWNLAKNNYPSIKYLNLIQKSRDYSLSNADRAIMPTQTEFFSYSSNSNVQQIGNISEEKPIKRNTSFLDNIGKKTTIKTNLSQSSEGSLQANLFTLNERINNLYFSLILIDKKIKLNELLQLQLMELYKNYASKPKTNNKAVLGSLESYQKITKSKYSLLKSQQQIYFKMLSAMVGKAINEKSVLIEPNIEQYLSKNDSRDKIDLFSSKMTNSYISNSDPQIKISNNDFLPENDFKVFDVAKASAKSSKKVVTKTIYPVNSTDVFSLASRKQHETERTEINQLNELINQDEELLTRQNQIVMITYNKVLNGDTDIANLIQDILTYDALYHTHAAHKVQLMMSINKFRFLYEK